MKNILNDLKKPLNFPKLFFSLSFWIILPFCLSNANWHPFLAKTYINTKSIPSRKCYLFVI